MTTDQPTSIVFLGGFLGAGKTTLMAAAAARWAHQGRRVALLTNDQADGLVDTLRFNAAGYHTAEVAGGCFCCRFDDLVARIQSLAADHAPDLLVAEPVGSCTDIGATVLRPLARYHAAAYQAKPYSVLIDVTTVAETETFSDNIHYLQHKQLEEADIVVLTKIDRVDAETLAAAKSALAAAYPGKTVMALSAQSGEGVDGWLNYVMQGQATAAAVDVDYARYAAGEAELGWLNAVVELEALRNRVDWAAFCRKLLEQVAAFAHEHDGAVAHVKLFLAGAGGSIAGNLTGNNAEPFISGKLPRTVDHASLTVNARVAIDPGVLTWIVEAALDKAAGRTIMVHVAQLDAFSPAEPRPTHRL